MGYEVYPVIGAFPQGRSATDRQKRRERELFELLQKMLLNQHDLYGEGVPFQKATQTFHGSSFCQVLNVTGRMLRIAT